MLGVRPVKPSPSRGVTILYTLHILYGLDPVHDMAIDRMHVF